jgi:hypothetical protein
VRSTFQLTDLASLAGVLQACLALPVTADSELGYMLTAAEDALLPLHAAIAKCAAVVEVQALAGGARHLLPGLFHLLLELGGLVHAWPEGAGRCGVKGIFPEKFILLGERCLLTVGRLYEKAHSLDCGLGELVVMDIVKAVQRPLELKYSCIKQSSWQISIEVLLSVLGVSMAQQQPTDRERMGPVWIAVIGLLDSFLFPRVEAPPGRTAEERREDEAIDCNIIEFLKLEVLARPAPFPHQFLLAIMVILNKGSIHSHPAGEEDCNQNRDLPLVLREDFAKTCFETLLQYSLLDQSEPGPTNGNVELVTNGVANLELDDAKITNKLAVTSLLHRFKEVLTTYISDEALHGPVPLPSHRVSEMSFVLKALATLIASLKRGKAGVDRRTWGLVIGLYPELVRATATSAQPVASSLQQVGGWL